MMMMTMMTMMPMVMMVTMMAPVFLITLAVDLQLEHAVRLCNTHLTPLLQTVHRDTATVDSIHVKVVARGA